MPPQPDPLPHTGERAPSRDAPEYPFGLDADRLVELISNCWRSHDGQWFLKAASRFGLDEAIRLNEAAIESLARIELREFRRATGTGSLDTMDAVADWYRLSGHLFGGLTRPDRSLTTVDADTLVVEHAHCFGEQIAERSGYGHLAPGEYPPCRGWLARQRAWGEAFSSRYRFAVEREPASGHPCRYVIRRSPREPAA